MPSIRAGNRSTLVVVDMQNGMMRSAWDATRIIDNVARAVARARAQGVPVIWVQHADEGLQHGSADWQWVPALVPAADEPVVGKRFNPSFEETLLDDHLARIGTTHITLAGAESNWCICATAYGALERGYDLTLVEDAHAAQAIEMENGHRIEALAIIDELNIAMTWLRYPGRTTRTRTIEELDFTVA